MIKLGHLFAERLSEATGPLVVAVPTEGLSIPSTPDGVFWNPESDAAFLDALRDDLGERRPDVRIETYAHHVNDPAFGEKMADLFADLFSEFSD